MKNFRYRVEAALLYFLFFAFGIMPVAVASAIGGFLGRTIGPKLGASKKARRNIVLALPEKSEAEQDQVLRGMWDNLGRLIAEYPHLYGIATARTTIVGGDILERVIEEHGQGIFIGGHLANFEINCATALLKAGVLVDITYRAPNNPWSDKLLQKARTLNGAIPAHAKSREGGMSLFRALKDGHSVGILIDQKYNEGLAVPFFGHEAMTNPAFVALAQKIDCPVVPIRAVRKDDARFEMHIGEPIELVDDYGKALGFDAVIAKANVVLEGWIREYPEQWLWLHRRWDSKKFS
ncbi:hypothetical protein N9Z27_01875 [Alphaproteobacteria bacterium]|nr:hypothetical protein [Alphaproteobacteria bacterium]